MTGNLCHIRLGFKRGHDHVQMFNVAQVNVNDHSVKIWFAFCEPQIRDIGLLFADQGTDAAQDPGIV
jgi:hypothetical protein